MLIATEGCFKFSSFVAGVFCLVLSLQTNAQTIDERIEKMSVEEKVGQLMIWTFAGRELTPSTRQMLAKYKIGALIAFSRNIRSIKQIAKFNEDVQKFAVRKIKVPLLLMVDQEGGSVIRVKVGTPIPGALALARVGDPKFIEEFAQTNAELLAAIGFNMNLAPVMDISNPDADTFISNRSFGNDPEDVTETSMAYARGVSATGVIPTAKHFPGHGGMSGDSHLGTPRKLEGVTELEARDWIPFQKFADAEFPKAIMMAHLSLPSVDPSGVPATYSRVIIKDYLRGKLKFDGLVVTDDLEMGGASISEDMGERAVRAFLAGNDMLMLAGHFKNQKKAYNAILAAVRSGRISTERLDASLRRILEIKTKTVVSRGVLNEKRTREIKSNLEALSKKVMEKNFRSGLDSKSSHWPVIRGRDEVLVLSADKRFYNHFSENLNGRASYQRLSPSTMAQARKQLARAKYPVIVYYASGSKTAKWLHTLAPELRAKMIIVNCNHPGKVESPDTFLGVLNLNSHSPESGGWLARTLSSPAELRSPAYQTGSTP